MLEGMQLKSVSFYFPIISVDLLLIRLADERGFAA